MFIAPRVKRARGQSERRAEAVSNRGPSAYQPNALPLGQIGSLLCVYMLCLSHAVYLCWCVDTQEALVFGSAEANQDPSSGRVLTATDVAVAAGLMDLGDTALVSPRAQGGRHGGPAAHSGDRGGRH